MITVRVNTSAALTRSFFTCGSFRISFPQVPNPSEWKVKYRLVESDEGWGVVFAVTVKFYNGLANNQLTIWLIWYCWPIGLRLTKISLD